MESVLLREIIFHSIDWQAIIEVSKSRKPRIMTGWVTHWGWSVPGNSCTPRWLTEQWPRTEEAQSPAETKLPFPGRWSVIRRWAQPTRDGHEQRQRPLLFIDSITLQTQARNNRTGLGFDVRSMSPIRLKWLAGRSTGRQASRQIKRAEDRQTTSCQSW